MTVDLRDIDPQTVIDPAHWEEYQNRKSLVHEQLMRLEISLFLLERTMSPEFEWLLQSKRSIHRNEFWDSTREAHFAQIALATHILWKDSGVDTDLASLSRFKNVVQTFVKPEYLQPLREALRPLARDAAINATVAKVDKLRSGIIAHRLDGMSEDEVRKLAVTIQEVKAVTKMLRSHFEVVCFGHGLSSLPIQYAGIEVRNTDIDELVQFEASSNYLVTMAERDPDRWHLEKQDLSKKDAEQIQFWRKQLGLPEAV